MPFSNGAFRQEQGDNAKAIIGAATRLIDEEIAEERSGLTWYEKLAIGNAHDERRLPSLAHELLKINGANDKAEAGSKYRRDNPAELLGQGTGRDAKGAIRHCIFICELCKIWPKKRVKRFMELLEEEQAKMGADPTARRIDEHNNAVALEKCCGSKDCYNCCFDALGSGWLWIKDGGQGGITPPLPPAGTPTGNPYNYDEWMRRFLGFPGPVPEPVDPDDYEFDPTNPPFFHPKRPS